MYKQELQSCCGVSIISSLSHGEDLDATMPDNLSPNEKRDWHRPSWFFSSAKDKENFRTCLRAHMKQDYRGGLQILVTTSQQDKYAAEVLIEEGWVTLAERFYNPLHTSLLTMWGYYKFPEKKGKLHVSKKHLEMLEANRAKIGNPKHKTEEVVGEHKPQYFYWTSRQDEAEVNAALEGHA